MTGKKKRIRYSELGVTPPKRVSTPVEIARALSKTPAMGTAVISSAPVIPSPPVIPSDARDLHVQEPRRDTSADLLVFAIGSERYAAELARIDEVIDDPMIHFVPEMPPAMLGVVSLRGRLVPVYSPATLLNVPLAAKRSVLVFNTSHTKAGIVVDDVDDALTIDLRSLHFPQETSVGGNVVVGVAPHGSSLVSLIDVDALIASCRSATFAGSP